MAAKCGVFSFVQVYNQDIYSNNASFLQIRSTNKVLSNQYLG